MKPIPTWETVVGVNHVPDTGYEKAMQEEIDALREKLAALEAQEPVGYIYVGDSIDVTGCVIRPTQNRGDIPVYIGAKP